MQEYAFSHPSPPYRHCSQAKSNQTYKAKSNTPKPNCPNLHDEFYSYYNSTKPTPSVQPIQIQLITVQNCIFLIFPGLDICSLFFRVNHSFLDKKKSIFCSFSKSESLFLLFLKERFPLVALFKRARRAMKSELLSFSLLKQSQKV